MTTAATSDPVIDIEIHEGLSGLQARWTALEESGAGTPFQSWAWTASLLDVFGKANRARCIVLIATDRKSGKDHLLLPLVQTRHGLHSALKMPDFGLSDYNSPLMSREILDGTLHFKRIWLKLIENLPRAGYLHLQKVPTLIDGRPNPLLSLPGFRKESYSSWEMTLPEGPLTPEIVFRGRPFKKRMRSFRRRLEESGTVSDFVPDTAEGRVELLKWLLTMQELRFERLGRKPSMPMADMLAFHSSIIREPSPGVAADVRGLAMDGKVIAALYGLRAGEKYFQIITAMDEEWAKLAPGLVLMWRTVEAMQRAGCRRYDFTIGDEDYKQDFATECVPIMEMMKPLSLTSLPAISWYAAHPKLVAAKRTLAAQEHPIMKSINKLLSR